LVSDEYFQFCFVVWNNLQRRSQPDIQLRLCADNAWSVSCHRQLRRARDSEESVRGGSGCAVWWSAEGDRIWSRSRENWSDCQSQDLLWCSHSQYVIFHFL